MGCQHVQSLKPLSTCGLQECGALFGAEWFDLLSRSTHSRRLHTFCGVARDESVRNRLRKRLAQHDVHLLYRRRRELRAGLISVEAAHVRWGQRLQLYMTESGGDVLAGDVGVVGVSRLFDGTLHGVCKPAVQILADRELPGVVEEAAVSVCHSFRELARDFRSGLACHRTPLAPFSGPNSVLGCPCAVLASVDRALIIAALLSHPCRLLRESAPKGQPPGLRQASLSFGGELPAGRPLCARSCCRRRRSSPPAPAEREPALSSVPLAAPH